MEKTEHLKKLFSDRKIVRREDILKTLGTEYWMTAYRQLKKLGYIASFTHTCSYYTLEEIPEFDEHGIWFFGEIGFSKWGNLQHTIKHLILNSEAGKTHEEIQQQLKTRAHNALQKLAEATTVAREKVNGVYAYVSPDPEPGKKQIDKRRKSSSVKSLPRALIIDILVQTIHSTVGIASHTDVAKSLRRRGIKVTNDQVYTVFKKYGLEKKTPD